MEDLSTAVGFNRVTASWRSIFPIEAAPTTRHGGLCGFGGDEAGLLGVFDSHRDLIYAIAMKIYLRARKGSYELSPADF